MKFALDFATVKMQYMVVLLFGHYFPSIVNIFNALKPKAMILVLNFNQCKMQYGMCIEVKAILNK
jgi:hypothetical protein